MKPITLKEAEQFDREAFHQKSKDKAMNLIIEWINREIELYYPELSYDEWYCHTGHPITGIPNYYDELKEMYNKVGFDFEWQPPYIRFKMKFYETT